MSELRHKDLMERVFGNPKYKGKHVIVIADQIFTASTGKQAQKILKRAHKKYPDRSPSITYIPKADTLILWLE